MKICYACKIPKSFDKFNKTKKSSDGCMFNCKVCSKIARKEHAQRMVGRMRTLVYQLKTKGCSLCPEKHPLIMQFHHVKENKIANIGSMLSRGKDAYLLRRELEKCCVVCPSCHVKIHLGLIDSDTLTAIIVPDKWPKALPKLTTAVLPDFRLAFVN